MTDLLQKLKDNDGVLSDVYSNIVFGMKMTYRVSVKSGRMSVFLFIRDFGYMYDETFDLPSSEDEIWQAIMKCRCIADKEVQTHVHRMRHCLFHPNDFHSEYELKGILPFLRDVRLQAFGAREPSNKLIWEYIHRFNEAMNSKHPDEVSNISSILLGHLLHNRMDG